jgi:hypothetical protein
MTDDILRALLSLSIIYSICSIIAIWAWTAEVAQGRKAPLLRMLLVGAFWPIGILWSIFKWIFCRPMWYWDPLPPTESK